MLALEAQRGRVIGNVVGGLMIGILLSRPIASLAAEAWGWRGSYALDAVVIAVTAPFSTPHAAALYAGGPGRLFSR